MADRSQPDAGFRPVWLVPLSAGLLLRLALLPAAIGIPLIGDEAHYVRLGADWQLFGLYTAARPPAYPWLMSLGIGWFGAGGPTALKLLQVLLSPLIGLGTMLLAGRQFGGRAALLAGAIWAGYLPLIGMTHLFWPETLFLVLLLPLLLLLTAHLEEPDAPRAPLRVLGLGLLVGTCMLLKDSALALFALVVAAIVLERFSRRRNPLASTAVFVLAVLIVVLPWILRNQDVHDRIAPPGSTLGMNFTVGMNGRYRNFDYGNRLIERAYPPESRVRRWLLEPQDESWEVSTHPNPIDRGRENVRRGLAFMAERPGFFLRTRVKKLADLFSPTSFLVRHAARGTYGAPLDGTQTRRAVVGLSLLSTAALLVAAWGGLVFGERRSRAWWLLPATCAAFVLPSLLNAMSRGRAPFLPVLIVLAAGLCARGSAVRRASTRAWITFAAGVVVLFLLWSLNAGALALLLEGLHG